MAAARSCGQSLKGRTSRRKLCDSRRTATRLSRRASRSMTELRKAVVPTVTEEIRARSMPDWSSTARIAASIPVVVSEVVGVL